MAVLVGVFIIVFVAALRVGIYMHKQHFWETLLKQALPPVRSLLPDAQLEDHDIKFKLHGCDAYIQWYFPDMGDDCTIFYVKFPQKQPSMTASLDAVKFSVSLKICFGVSNSVKILKLSFVTKTLACLVL